MQLKKIKYYELNYDYSLKINSYQKYKLPAFKNQSYRLLLLR